MTCPAPQVRVEVTDAGSTFCAEGRPVSGASLLTPSGGADVAASSPQSTAHLDLAYATGDTTHVVVDHSRVALLDRGGLGRLVRLRGAALARGGPVRLVAIPPRIDRVLRISGVLELVEPG